MKKNQYLSGVKNQNRGYKGEEMVVESSWENVSSVEKLDIDLLSVFRDQVRGLVKIIVWHMKSRYLKMG